MKSVFQKILWHFVLSLLSELTCSKQSNKPIWGCYASSIREIRSSSPLETPDEDNAFVIRTLDKEFIIRVTSSMEKSSWILMIRRVCTYQDSRYIPFKISVANFGKFFGNTYFILGKLTQRMASILTHLLKN